MRFNCIGDNVVNIMEVCAESSWKLRSGVCNVFACYKQFQCWIIIERNYGRCIMDVITLVKSGMHFFFNEMYYFFNMLIEFNFLSMTMNLKNVFLNIFWYTIFNIIQNMTALFSNNKYQQYNKVEKYFQCCCGIQRNKYFYLWTLL